MVVSHVLLMTGCTTVAPLTQADRDLLANPSAPVADRVALLEPEILKFDQRSDRIVLARGRTLDADEVALARAVGVAHPERIRVLVTDLFPEPADERLAKAMRPLGPAYEAANTTGYGIEIRPHYASSRWIYAHELTHVAQYERMGTVSFTHEYLIELLTVGYARAPLEAAARANERL